MMNRIAFKNYQSMNLVHKTKEGNQLWLGDYYAATNVSLLKQKEIKAVLTAAAMLGVQYHKDHEINHKVINAFDVPTYKMTPHFEEVFKWMDDHLKKGNILVHCAAGISRSTTCVIVYLMRQQGMSFQQAITSVRSKRPIICPNQGFQRQLKKFQLELKKNGSNKPTQDNQKKNQASQINKQQKVILDFLNQPKKKTYHEQQLNLTIGGSKIAEHKVPIKRNEMYQSSFTRGKSTNYHQSKHNTNNSAHQNHNPVLKSNENYHFSNYAASLNKFNGGQFLTFKLEQPKIVTIKK